MGKIDRRIFRYIEYELYNYDATKKEYARCREQLLEGTPLTDDIRVQNGLSDLTATKVLRLTSAYLAHAERIIAAIEDALKVLSDQHRGVFKLKYHEGATWMEIVSELYISERQYFKLRREIVVLVGQKLGHVVI